ncbi:putative Protein-lysine N-methyltransferase EEF2KMT [Nannochloris sp. 'desiccata']|nr:putative Protein-lysine N-methyltransferase EEF2KMT [Chlorella desiccata (nom. nud.)]
MPMPTNFARGIDNFLAMSISRSKLLRAVVLAVESDGHELTEELMTAFSKRLITDIERNNNSCSQWSYKLYAYSNSGGGVNDTGLSEGIRKSGQAGIENAAEVMEAETEAIAATHNGLRTTTKGDERSGLLALHVSNDMLAGETGCWDWEAGFFLSEYIFNHPGLFRGKNILELGSRCGMAGVALARVSAASVLCTDGDVEALENCRQNLRINGLEVADTAVEAAAGAVGGVKKGRAEISEETEMPSIAVQRLRWEDGIATLPTDSIDIVVGADLTYDPVNIPPLVKILKEVLISPDKNTDTANDVVAYIATTRRSEATFQKFVDALEHEVELQVDDISKEGGTEAVGYKTASCSVRFCHVASLEAARERIVLHRITRRKI